MESLINYRKPKFPPSKGMGSLLHSRWDNSLPSTSFFSATVTQRTKYEALPKVLLLPLNNKKQSNIKYYHIAYNYNIHKIKKIISHIIYIIISLKIFGEDTILLVSLTHSCRHVAVFGTKQVLQYQL